jgi:hypothetical protein
MSSKRQKQSLAQLAEGGKRLRQRDAVVSFMFLWHGMSTYDKA